MFQRVTFSLFLVSLLAACGGSSSSNSSNSGIKPITPGKAEYAYLFNQSGEIHSVSSIDNTFKKVFSKISDTAFSIELVPNKGITFSALLTLANGQWQVVSQENNEAKVLSTLSGIDEVCATKVQKNSSNTRLYFQLPGVDNDCDAASDNKSYAVNTDMTEESLAVEITDTRIFENNTVEVLIGNVVIGYIVKQDNALGSTLNFLDIDLANAVTLQTTDKYDPLIDTFNTYSYPAGEHVILRIGGHYSDVTLAQLQSGSLGTEFLSTGSGRRNVQVVSGSAYLLLDTKLHKHVQGTDASEAFDELEFQSVSNISVGNYGTLIYYTDAGTTIQKFVLIDERNAEGSRFISLDALQYDSSGISSSSIGVRATVDGYLVEIRLGDDQKAYYVSDSGAIKTYPQAKWVDNNVLSGSSDVVDGPLLAQFENEKLNIRGVDSAIAEGVIEYGNLSDDINYVRANPFTIDGKLILTTSSDVNTLDGQVYQIELGVAGSMKKITEMNSFSVLF